MYSIPCPDGRRQAAHLASMNMRAVVGPYELTYVARPRPKLALVTTLTGAQFQPRDEAGRFVFFADLWCAINVEYAMTAFSYDEANNDDELDEVYEVDECDQADAAIETDKADKAEGR